MPRDESGIILSDRNIRLRSLNPKYSMPLRTEFYHLERWASHQMQALKNKHEAWKTVFPIKYAMEILTQETDMTKRNSAANEIWSVLPFAVTRILFDDGEMIGCPPERSRNVPPEEQIVWSLEQIDEYAAQIARNGKIRWKSHFRK